MATRGVQKVKGAGAPEPRPAGGARLPPIRDAREGEEEHRHFPRAELSVRFEVWRDGERGRTFSASLRSLNLSVNGAFLESTFFLPQGTELSVRFALEPEGEPVEARATIVREERPGPQGSGRSGFGIHFLEFSGQTEVTLARLFLEERLSAFADDYLRSRRARALPSERERVVDALAAWELRKATTPGDPWRGEG